MKRGSAIRGLVVGGAFLLSACGTNDSDTVGPGGDPAELVEEAELPAANGAVPPDKRASLGASPAIPQEPLECREVIKKNPCTGYRIELLGDVTNNSGLRQKYKAAFGSACYMSATNSFNCYFESADEACKQVMFVPGIAGAANYGNYPGTCKKKAGNIWTLQTGPDPANVTYIYYEDLPLESSLIEVNGVPTAINGPYRNLPEPSTVKVGGRFDCYRIDGMTQNARLIQINRDAHKNAAGVGEIHSDLAGFAYYCNGPNKPPCFESTVLKKSSENHDDAARVHHVIRKTDLRSCKWGSNSNKNAVVISRKLNGFLYNKYPQADEVNRVNQVPAYTP
jgi:hypothetical protein